MKKGKLQLKKLTIRVLLDEGSLKQVAGGLTARGCTGGAPSDVCPTTGCPSGDSDIGARCTYADCTGDRTVVATTNVGTL